ncbi:MAG: sialidase family protein, partial [Planctomycetota bacterium]
MPNGTYDVSVTAGDLSRWWHDQMGFYLEGALVDTLSTDPGQVLPPQTYEVAVEDGQLTLLLDDLGGTDPNVCIVALEVIPIQLTPGTEADDVSTTNEDDDSPPATLDQGDGFVANMNNEALPVEAHFDFGEPSSPVESGYTKVTASTAYTSEQGYGWLTGEITSRDRAVGSALERDFNFTREGVFVVDVPNGTYDVTVTAGDLGLWWHDQMGFYLEGALVDTLSTDPGQVLPPQTYEVTVNDGQLTLLLKDLGGTDPNVCIVALKVVPIQLTPGITVTPTSGLTTTEAGGTATFTVRLDTAPTENVSIDLSSNKPLEGTVSPGTLTFTPTDWNVEKPVTVTGVDDPDPDGNQPYTIVTARADSADAHYNVINPADVSVTNVDDDAPPFESHFDFGQPTSPVESGYTRVTEAGRYAPELGYGWLSGEITSRDRAVGSALERDFNFTREGVFVVDVPNGTYDVTVTAGDLGRWWHDQMGFYLEGVLVDTLSTDPGQVLPPQTYEVSVNDGQLTLLLRDLGGTDPNVCIEALDIEVRDTTPPVVVIESPATGLMTDTNVTVTGHVTDDLSGVASLDGQVDSGSFFDITFDSSGNFTFDTALPLDGSADGEHACRLRATDQAGNVSGFVEVAFTLEMAGVNRAITTDPGVQQMPSIAVNPLDSNHLVIAYMDYSLPTADAGLAGEGYAGIGVAVSRDGGNTWQHTSIPLPENFDEGAANPIVKFDAQGRVYVSFMAATFLGEKPPLTNANFFNPERGASDREFGFQANNGVFVAHSDDGGLTWNEPAAVVSHLYEGEDVFFEVIPDIAIDTFDQLPDGQPNPNYGNIYVTWTRLYPPGQFPGEPESTGGGDIMIAVSPDGGANWETQLQDGRAVISEPENTGTGPLAGLAAVDQARVTVGAEGEIYVAFFDGGDFSVYLSTDSGASFVGPDVTRELRTAFGTGFATFVNADGLPNNRFRTHTARAIFADAARPGHVYAVEAIPIFDAVGNQIDGADIFLAKSGDLGETWETSFMVGANPPGIDELPEGSRVPLNDDNDAQSATSARTDDVISGQAMPRLGVDAQGNIGVIWYDTRRDPADHLL